MKHVKKFIHSCLLTAIVLTLASCTTAGITPAKNMFPEPAAGRCGSEPGDKIIVAGISEDRQRREMFETALCKQLKKSGFNAVASFKVLSINDPAERQIVVKKARANDADYVFLAKITGVDEKLLFSSYDPVLHYLGPGNTAVNLSAHQQQYVEQNAKHWKHIKVSCQLFEAGSGKTVWSDQLDIDGPAKGFSPDKVISKAVKKIPYAMSKYFAASN